MNLLYFLLFYYYFLISIDIKKGFKWLQSDTNKIHQSLEVVTCLYNDKITFEKSWDYRYYRLWLQDS